MDLLKKITVTAIEGWNWRKPMILIFFFVKVFAEWWKSELFTQWLFLTWRNYFFEQLLNTDGNKHTVNGREETPALTKGGRSVRTSPIFLLLQLKLLFKSFLEAKELGLQVLRCLNFRLMVTGLRMDLLMFCKSTLLGKEETISRSECCV